MNIRYTFLRLAIVALMSHWMGQSTLSAQGTAFTYQGRLEENGTPASGQYDLQFNLYGVASGGAALTGGIILPAHPVNHGLFTVVIDFGGQFPGGDRWLEIAARTNGGPAFTTLAPRQKITATPYAITAGTITGTVPGAGLSGTYGGAVTLNNAANQFTGAFAGSGTGLSNVNAAALNGLGAANFWQTNGNLGANPTNGAFAGTRDNLPFELRVNGQRTMRYEPVAPFGAGAVMAPNVIGGSVSNQVLKGARGATIAGGGPRDAGEPGHVVSGDFGTIGGGRENQVLHAESTVAGGRRNLAEGFGSSIGGGYRNVATTNHATVAGGVSNLASSVMATVGGGLGNTARGPLSTVVGGGRNDASGAWATVLGGSDNIASGVNAVGGGFAVNAPGNSAVAIGHVTTASGPAATALGNSTRAIGGAALAAGLDTEASGNSSTALGEGTVASGSQSTALGQHSRALGWRSTALGANGVAAHDGTFVWSDGSRTNFQSTAANQFLLNAQAGVGINTNQPQATLHVAGSHVRVEGVGGEAAYLGGDGVGGDVQIGSLNPGIQNAALWNAATFDYMSLFAKDAHFTGTISGDGSGLTGLSASQFTGTLPDSVLSPNVALRAGGNTFTGDQILAAGNLTLSSPGSSVIFPPVPGANSPMIHMFASGTANADRMVVSHSPAFSSYGLQYRDVIDEFNFLGAGSPVLSVGLGSRTVGVNTPADPNTALKVNGAVGASSVSTPAAHAGDLVVTNRLRVPGAGINTATPAFVHRVTATGPFGRYASTIDHPLCNNDPNAILIITHNYNPGKTGNILNTRPTSVYYNEFIDKWQIYHDDYQTNTNSMTIGDSWNVLVIKP